MESTIRLKPQILQAIIEKSNLSQQVFDNTFAVMTLLKETLHELASELDDELEERLDDRVKIEYRDRGKFEAHFTFGENLLIFSMHTDIFRFPPDDAVWHGDYACANHDHAACGIINVWNFLKDSFEHKRLGDEGYLVARIFVNREMSCIVEGKGQSTYPRAEFGRHRISKQGLTQIIEDAIGYSLDFDLFVPPYEAGKVVTAEQFNTKFENSKLQTGKRLGYEFRTDDVK